MKPDLVWLKSRSNARDHRLMDTVRGINLGLQSNLTNAEFTGTALSSINSNGFTLNTTDNQNVSAEPYIGWQWQAGQGTNTTNTAGSITSTVSVNATAGFSVVKFTSQASGTGTVGHGLGVAPKFIITKLITDTSGANWNVYHASIGNTGIVNLNTTGATITNSQYWNNTTPTSNVFTVGTWYAGSLSTIAYCWSEIAGFSKFTSYTGNGSTDGPFIFLGFRPKYVLLKRTNSTGDWETYDTSRDLYNPEGQALFPNLSNAESSISPRIDLLSNGFKLRTSGAGINGSGDSYIVAAFAENPFKNSNAR
jgi:hypothetical protein